MTSHDVVDLVRKRMGTRQVGHAGTLDPLAEGLLIVLVGEYTKKSEEFMKLPKTYGATFRLGVQSDTHDMEGEIKIRKDFTVPTEEDIKKVLESFRGNIKQTPPQFSAIKINGKKAYNEARAGREVALLPREINISRLEIISYKFPDLDLKIDCSSGTYIRALARDIGEALGTGAVMARLKREAVDQYNLKDAVNLDDVDEKTLRDSDTHRQP